MTHEDPRAYFLALLRRIAPGLDGSSVQAGQKAIAQVPVGRSTAERLVAIGEAAGHVKTSTGGGIYYGLLSAEFAAEVVLRAFRQGDFSASRFSDFERYWRSAFGNELLTGYFARELAASLPDSALERIFDLVNSRKILARLNGLLKFDWHRRALLATLGSLMLARGGNGHG
jgi:flavin-dependent dehydrogenase